MNYIWCEDTGISNSHGAIRGFILSKRFNESDVIVASGGVPMGPLGINGFTTQGTGMMTYNDIDYTG